jgi:acyl-coenzyme A thioesterase PaaI-like protein
LDNGAWFAGAVHLPNNALITTASLSVNFIKQLTKKDSYCIGKVVKIGKNIVFTRSELYEKGSDDLIAYANAILNVKIMNSKL